LQTDAKALTNLLTQDCVRVSQDCQMWADLIEACVAAAFTIAYAFWQSWAFAIFAFIFVLIALAWVVLVRFNACKIQYGSNAVTEEAA